MIRMTYWLLTLVLNANSGLEPSDHLVSAGYQGNPWGPVATQERLAGELPTLEMTPEMRRWHVWGRQHLKTGDVLFRRGDAHILFGYFPFSRFIANANNSDFSHTAILIVEDGEPMAYDTTKLGVRRQPLGIWTMDTVGAFGVKRLQPEYQDGIPKVVQFVHQAYLDQVPFDFNLREDDEALYCVEMTEKAFRAAGLKLSEPIPLNQMERAWEYPLCMNGLHLASKIVLDRPLEMDQPVFFPGNDRNGIWSSPYLQKVFLWSPEDESARAEARVETTSLRQVPGGATP